MKVTFSNLPAIGWTLPASKIVDLARLAEEVGFNRFGVADYRFYHDCFVTMTACLQATSRLEVESLVTDPFIRHPSLSATAIATMNDLFGGRAILGLGGGVEQPAFWGESRPHPLQAVREAVEICRRMWRGEEVTLEGQVIQVRGARLSFAIGAATRVLIAARGAAMLRLAGEVADIAHIASLFVNVDHQRENVALVLEGAQRAGRQPGDFEIDFSVPVCVSTDRTMARRAARRTAAQGILWMAGAEKYSRDRKDWQQPPQLQVSDAVVTALAGWDVWAEPELPDDLAALISDDLLDQFAVAGEPAECTERLSALAAALPQVTGVRLKLPPPIGPHAGRDYAEAIVCLGGVIDRLKSVRPAEAARSFA